jgi:hypothetical protein
MAERYVGADPYPWLFNGDLRPENTALIVIDMQIDFCGVLSGLPVSCPTVDDLAVSVGCGFGARELIRAHTGEGRERAKARGRSLGRSFKLAPHQRSSALRRRDRGETLTNVARSYNVHPSTISRLTA